jgi:hypothetical protein
MSYIQRLLDKKKETPTSGTGKTGETPGSPVARSVEAPACVPAEPAKPSSAGFAGSRRGESSEPWSPRRPPAVVEEIGDWPIPWRQRLGELSNQFEDEGVPFPDSERHAYHQVKAEMEATA